MKLIAKSGPVILIGLALIPIALWRKEANWQTPFGIWRSLAQVTALVGTCMLSLNFALSARVKWLENFFGGLPRMYIIHALLGSGGFSLILLHPVFMAASYLTLSPELAGQLFLPSMNDLPRTWGLFALIGFITLVGLTLYIKMEYQSWKRTHRLMGLAFGLAVVHIVTSPTTLVSNTGLRYYMWVICGIGIVAFLYKQFSGRLGRNRYAYTVSKVEVVENVTKVTVEPKGKQMEFKPGQFGFFVFKSLGVAWESHPFSFTSAPTEKGLSIAARSLGDFTETLKLLKTGAEVKIEGPFGRFSYEFFPRSKQLWIAGGIGITPFLSMAKALPQQGYQVSCWYSVKDVNEAIFDEELKQVCQAKNINYVLYDSKNKGRLTAQVIGQAVPDTIEREIFICGPPSMMQALKTQFRKMGVPRSHIHTEEFALS